MYEEDIVARTRLHNGRVEEKSGTRESVKCIPSVIIALDIDT